MVPIQMWSQSDSNLTKKGLVFDTIRILKKVPHILNPTIFLIAQFVWKLMQHKVGGNKWVAFS